MSQPNKFWVYFIIFVFFCSFYIWQSFLGNEVLNAVSQNMFILVGMVYGVYLVHLHGYEEGYRKGFREGREDVFKTISEVIEDGKTESNKTES